MELLNAFYQLNWWAVIAATAANFVVGFFWYNKQLFGKQWMRLVGLTDKDMNRSTTNTYVATGVAALVGTAMLGTIMVGLSISGILSGLLLGAIIGAIFRLGTHVIHNGFSSRPAALTVIDGGYDIISLAVAGAILGIWI